ncbi:MAG TPA: helix-hairpin-helix domain-containing protein, partial [Candidatus Limnocylindrales bacterium]|nr:helix-hairpin-helix domain-containing protein [Candidatus Limnocylindrales bacterium]
MPETQDPADGVAIHDHADDEPGVAAEGGDTADAPAPAQRDLTNGDLARIFHEIGDILEVKGELVFKTVAYHRAADAIGRAPFDVAEAYRSGNAPKIPGVGQAISDKITELAQTGRMSFHEKLRAEVPASLVELLRIPGLGPRTVRLIYEQLGIETIEDLRQAAEAGTLHTLRGVTE